MDSSPCVEVPIIGQHINNQNINTFIDSEFYKAAAKGQIDPFNSYTEPLNLLLTPTKNTILHIHISQQPKGAYVSIEFMEQILAKCPSLLLQTNNRGETLMHMASRQGNATLVKFLIDSARANHHQDIETGAGAGRTMLRMENIDKETALHEAARHNNPIIVEILTKEDPEFTYSVNKLGETPLYLAVERGYCDMVFQMLDTCSSPSFDGPNGRTALHEAVIRDSSEMTAKIVAAEKTLVKEVDKHGWAPLHHASYLGHLSIVMLLLARDKSVAYIADNDGMIPLHLAASCGHSHEKVVFSILEHCPDCNELVDHKGRNVLHFVVQSRSYLLLSHMLEGPDKGYYLPLMSNLINQKDVDGNTPLHLLATYCFYNSSLIEHPLVDKMAVNNNNSTPLDVVSESADDHDDGLKGFTKRCMRRVGGYKHSRRDLTRSKDVLPRVTDTEKIERIKNSHVIVAALLVTVTFTAAFTMPGGYDSNKGTATLSRNLAFVGFVISDALAFVLSTCALFLYYSSDLELSKRRKTQLVLLAARFIMFSIFLMIMAFEAAAVAVLQHSIYLRVSIGVITILSVIICFYPLRRVFGAYVGAFTQYMITKISSTLSNKFVEVW